MKEAYGSAVIDSGCTSTVCGFGWLDDFLEKLSDYEYSNIKEEPSTVTFTFGDGVAVKSVKRITIPCVIGNLRGTITTDVVNTNIPLLLSKKSMKRAGMVLDFANDSLRIRESVVNLNCTSSGHYILPL
ncbi:MAG: hypothetical protein AAFO82_12375 [Bacteroidota bacterium]